MHEYLLEDSIFLSLCAVSRVTHSAVRLRVPVENVIKSNCYSYLRVLTVWYETYFKTVKMKTESFRRLTLWRLSS
jgi:hypothetical protein